MARYIPPHPKKGSAEAKAWGARMRALRTKKNPGAAWHETEAMSAAEQAARVTPGSRAASFYIGKRAAHTESAIESGARGMNPRRRKSGATAYDMAVHHGFAYIVTETEPIVKRGIVFSAFSKYADRRKPWLYVGYNHKTRRWHIFGDQPLAKGIPGVGQMPRENPRRKNPIAIYNKPKAWYLGRARTKELLVKVFQAGRIPTQQSHGHQFKYIEGPFRSKQAAIEHAHWLGFTKVVNPNPILPMRNIQVRYTRHGGQHHGERFEHRYTPSVRARGEQTGRVCFESPKGKKLWGA